MTMTAIDLLFDILKDMERMIAAGGYYDRDDADIAYCCTMRANLLKLILAMQLKHFKR